jgi:hypothetical protein
MRKEVANIELTPRRVVDDPTRRESSTVPSLSQREGSVA